MPSRRSPSSESVLNRAPLAYKLLDHITGVMLAFVVVFTPWAFGATVSWAIWTTCGVSYAMGVLLIAKWIYRARGDFQVATWADPSANAWPMRLLAFLSGSFLLYVLIGAVNYRATGTYVDGELELDYRDAISWLPHSFNAPKSWRAFWRYLALVCLFWSARDWLLGKSRRERRSVEDSEDVSVPLLPSRLRRFLWVFCISSALLSLMGLLQRYDGSNKLLWILEARESNPNDFSFGPYSYRANAAQYFNLAWPVCLGFWWTLRKDSRRIRDRTVRAGSQSHVMLIPCLVFMATGPIASTSRGGALIFFATTAAALLVMLWSLRSKPMAWLGIVGFFAASLTIAVVVGGDKLMERFETVFQDKMSGRTVLYEVGHKMAADYPLFGTGAETFVSMYPLYRIDPTAQREGYAHDDWLETRITLGWVGLGILLAALLTIPWNWFSGRGVPGSLEFVLLLAVALGGLLAHAKFDFPFQIFSLLTVFLLLACVGTCLRRENV